GCANGLAATNVSCKLSSPKDVAVNSAGDLFIADTSNNRIAWVPHHGSSYSTNVYGYGTVPLTADAMYPAATSASFPYGVALDSSSNVYYTDTANSRVKEALASNGTVSTLAGNGTPGHCSNGSSATGACVSTPQDIAVDGSSVYYVDSNNYLE